MTNCFKNSTVITIAHRVSTIMGMDKILVLDKGKKAEFDSPTNLLENKESLFYGIWEEYSKEEEKLRQ